mmetsp:Transcript_9799/g.21213  ORF Transcript_9799/g.21213 Transcript_9799/m.21213 type:complete len:287 (-) Transcript_9799:354-1214(-)
MCMEEEHELSCGWRSVRAASFRVLWLIVSSLSSSSSCSFLLWLVSDVASAAASEGGSMDSLLPLVCIWSSSLQGTESSWISAPAAAAACCVRNMLRASEAVRFGKSSSSSSSRSESTSLARTIPSSNKLCSSRTSEDVDKSGSCNAGNCLDWSSRGAESISDDRNGSSSEPRSVLSVRAAFISLQSHFDMDPMLSILNMFRLSKVHDELDSNDDAMPRRGALAVLSLSTAGNPLLLLPKFRGSMEASDSNANPEGARCSGLILVSSGTSAAKRTPPTFFLGLLLLL